MELELQMVESRVSSNPMGCPRCLRTFEPGRVICPLDGVALRELEGNADVLEETPTSDCSTVIGGRYELGELIGQGAMARVYAATDLDTGGCVAVKILGRKYADIPRERLRFFREARAILQIDHPNVVKALDVGRRIDGRPFLVIDYLRGESLGQLMRRRGSLPTHDALRLLSDAAQGLQAVHEAGIVHRDVKPDNIFLVDEPGSPSTARLVDFGLAKLHTHTGHSSESATAMGTAAYMAPEQVLSEPVDARADIYSLGVVLFRALTGHLPFQGAQDLDLLAHQVLLACPPPSWFIDNLDPRLDAVVKRATHKHPANRYASMRELNAELCQLMEGAAPVAHAPLAVVPDSYEPSTGLGRQAALMFCRKLGIVPPWDIQADVASQHATSND